MENVEKFVYMFLKRRFESSAQQFLKFRSSKLSDSTKLVLLQGTGTPERLEVTFRVALSKYICLYRIRISISN